MDGHDELSERPVQLPVEGALSVGDALGAFVRNRAHRLPGRRNALQVLYHDVEVASVRAAAQLAGLTPNGFDDMQRDVTRPPSRAADTSQRSRDRRGSGLVLRCRAET